MPEKFYAAVMNMILYYCTGGTEVVPRMTYCTSCDGVAGQVMQVRFLL